MKRREMGKRKEMEDDDEREEDGKGGERWGRRINPSYPVLAAPLSSHWSSSCQFPVETWSCLSVEAHLVPVS